MSKYVCENCKKQIENEADSLIIDEMSGSGEVERGVEVMTEKLKPCPFCGSKSVSKKTGVVTGLSMFLCYSCGATVSFQNKEHDPQATHAWNRRPDNAN